MQQILNLELSRQKEQDFELPPDISLPVRSLNELLGLESKLQDDSNFRKVVCSVFL